jgi:signal peptide peptidase SppA
MKMLEQLHHLFGKPWAVTPEMAEAGRRLFEALLSEQMGLVGQVAPLRQLAEIHAQAPSAARADRGKPAGNIMVIPVVGLLTQRGDVINSMTTESSAALAGAVRAAGADESVEAIVLELDSPGGEVFGIPEAATAIRETRAAKPIVAAANSVAGSAAYWLGSQATELVVTPSGEVGSIGVWTSHADHSKQLDQKGVKVSLIYAGKYKVEGHPYGPLEDEARAGIQADVDRFYGMFVAEVAKGRSTKERPVSVDAVRNGYGEGRMLGAPAAVKAGMADAIGTLEDAIRRAVALARERRRDRGAAAALDLRQVQRQRG